GPRPARAAPPGPACQRPRRTWPSGVRATSRPRSRPIPATSPRPGPWPSPTTCGLTCTGWDGWARRPADPYPPLAASGPAPAAAALEGDRMTTPAGATRIFVAITPEESDRLYDAPTRARLAELGEVTWSHDGSLPADLADAYDVLITSWSTRKFDP